MSILSNGVDGFNASVEEMIKSTGATETAFGIMADTTENKMAKAKNSINNLQIVLGQNLLPIVGNVADKVAGAVTRVSEFAQANPQLVQTVMKVVGALAALKLGGLGLKLGFQELKLGVVNVQYVLELLKSKFLIAQAGSIGLAGRLKLAGKGVLTYFGNVGSALGGVTSALGNILTNNPLARAAGGLFTRVGMVMEQQMKLESSEKILTSRKKLNRDEKRIAELKRLFIKIYEDNASGRLSDERFDMLSQSYEAEQKQLEAEVVSLRQEIEVQARQSENIEKFIQTAQKYVSIETLDPYALRELVQAIYVEAPDKSSGKRRQNIHIKYDGLGFIPLDELTKGETA